MKGLIVEKSKIYYILLTPSGEYKRIPGFTDKEVGEETEIPATQGSSVVRLAALAAVIAVIFLAQSIYSFFGPGRIYGYVTVDINPSAEFAISYNDLVLEARPFNDEAEYILAEVDYKGRKIDDALADFTKQAIKHEYITRGKQNRIVIAFVPKKVKYSNSGAQKLEQLKQKEEQILKEAGENAKIETLILDMKTRKEAESKGISSSKLDNKKRAESTASDNEGNTAGINEVGSPADNTPADNHESPSADDTAADNEESPSADDNEEKTSESESESPVNGNYKNSPGNNSRNSGSHNNGSHNSSRNNNGRNVRGNDKKNNKSSEEDKNTKNNGYNNGNSIKNNGNQNNNKKSKKNNKPKNHEKNEHFTVPQKDYYPSKYKNNDNNNRNFDNPRSNKDIKGNNGLNKNNNSNNGKGFNDKEDDKSNKKSSKNSNSSKNKTNINKVNSSDNKKGLKDINKVKNP